MLNMARSELSDGPTSKAVRANVRRLREELGYSYAELSRRLDEVGHPLAVLALRRIEEGERRVTVDDLSALAVVLGVNPNALLSPGGTDEGGVTGGPANTDALEATLWLLGLDLLRGMPAPSAPPPLPMQYHPKMVPGSETVARLAERYTFWERSIPTSDSLWPSEAMRMAQATYDQLRVGDLPVHLRNARGVVLARVPGTTTDADETPEIDIDVPLDQVMESLLAQARDLRDMVQDVFSDPKALRRALEAAETSDNPDGGADHGED